MSSKNKITINVTFEVEVEDMAEAIHVSQQIQSAIDNLGLDYPARYFNRFDSLDNAESEEVI